jgi:hypothetical protein
MAEIARNELSQELEDLFDIRNAKVRDEKRLTQEANEVQRDIRLLALMFRDGIPNIDISVGDSEAIRWDADSQKLLYIHGKAVQILEGTSRETRIRMRPHLSMLVKKAKEFYQD